MYAYDSIYRQQYDLVGRLRAELEGLLHINDIQTGQRGEAVVFAGRLASDAETVFNRLQEPFRRLGYTPFLRRDADGTDVIVARRGVVDRTPLRWGINAALLGLTVLTTLFFGASFAGVNPLEILRGGSVLEVLAAGAPFAFSLLFILGVHEMGHYVAAKVHGVHVTLPYFIPVPFGLGTFGAFIQMKSPVHNRKALFDVGVAGPLAGFVVAFVLMVVGLFNSALVPATETGQLLGRSLLVDWLIDVIFPNSTGMAVALHPVAVAAWFGMLVTGLNLLPMGQLDGGHIAYALLGKSARTVAFATLFLLLVLGWTIWSGWFTWAILALITGLRHAEPLNDITPLDGGRKFIGAMTLVLFLLVITLKPF